MALLSKPGLIPLQIESNGNLITTQVNKINFVGAVTGSIGNFNDITIQIGIIPTASFAISSSYALVATTASYALTSTSASYASASTSASYAATASFVAGGASGFPYTGSAQITGSLGITGSFSQSGSANIFLQGLINQTTATSHVVTFNNATGQLFITASSAFGGGGGGGTPGGATNTIQFNNAGTFSGSGNFTIIGGNTVSLTGSLLVTGSSRFLGPVTGSSFTGSFTGSLFGTSSWAVSASQAISSSRAISSSFALTSSFAISSSFALSASFVAYDNIVEFSDLSRNTIASIKNVSGGSIPKGTPCYVTSSGVSGNLLGVVPADAGNPSLMPAGIISAQALNNGDEGLGYIDGFINGVNTSAFNSGDEVFVAVGGGYTNIKPTGSALIQPLGYVEKVDSSNGSGLINGPGHFFEVPNITSGHTWVGNINQVAIPISTASLFVSSSISSSYALSSSFATSASNANSASTVYIASNGGTDANYTLVFKNSAGALDNYYQLAADGTNGPYYNPSTNILGGVGGITVSGSIGRFNTITGSVSITGSLTGSLLGTSSFATTASYALSAATFPYTGSAIISGSLGVTGSISQADNLGGLSITQEIINSSIPLGLNAVVTKTISGPASMFLDYQIISGSNQRTGTIIANFNNLGTPTSTYYETVTGDIGNTSVISFLTDGTPPYTIQANNSGPNSYTFKAILRYF